MAQPASHALRCSYSTTFLPTEPTYSATPIQFRCLHTLI